MDAQARERVGEILGEALAIDADKREAFLRSRCGDDSALLAEVSSLLAASDRAGGFLHGGATAGAVNAAREPLASSRPGEGPGSRIGRYRLLQQIGEGGFGAVFMAEQHEPMHRLVAIKIIKLGMDTEQVIARFEAERQALALMDHPNIARVLDGGATPSGRPYFVMELVRGEPIDAYCDQRTLSTEQRLDLFRQVCHAVQHAHSKGIIHRDIKPGNILVSEVDGRAVPKVIDFGIAKATSARLTEKTLFTEFRQMIGTPAYMSPEQAAGGGVDIDTATDVYSLGVLLYELLTGETPFDAKALRSAAWGEMQRIIREDDPPRPSTRLSTMKDRLPSVAAQRQTEPGRLTARLRGDLDWIAMRCLEKDRSRRYPTADALAEDIRRHLAGEPVAAAPPSRRYRAMKFAARHRGALATVGGVALALIAALAITGYGLNRAVAAERRAVEQFEQAEKARAAAVAEKERAERYNRIANAVTEFFTQDLLDLKPTPQGGREVTVRELLDAVPAKIDRYFKSEPAVEGIIRERVGQLYRRIGELGRSTEYLVQAIPLLEAGLGPDSKMTLSAVHRLGELKMDQRRYDEAEAQFDKAYQGRLQAYGMEYAMTVNSLVRRGAARVAAGRVEAGLADAREAVAHAEKAGGRESRNFVVFAMSLGTMLVQAGRAQDALSISSELLDTIKRKQGNLAGLEWPVRQQLAEANLGLGHADEALRHADEMVRLLEANYPPTHQTQVDGKLCRGQALAAVGRDAEAAAAFEGAFELANGVYGLGNEYSRTAARLRAALAEKSGDPDAAELWRSRAR